MANMLVDQSVEVGAMEVQTENVNDQSEKIATQIRDETSIAAISSRAQTLGFSPVSSYSYIPRPQNVAARIEIPLR